MNPGTSGMGEPRPLIGITMGDPLGIGPEVVIKALADLELRSRARFCIFGQHEILEIVADQIEQPSFWWREPFEHGPRITSGVLALDFDDMRLPYLNGKREADPLAGQASFRFVEEGIRHLRTGVIDALVTAPICKQAWQLANQRFVDHTTLLMNRFESRRVSMMFAAGRLRVALASSHIPLFELRHQFTIGLVYQPIDLLNEALREWFGVDRPHIGVLGLNPHAGEGGLLGDEEIRIIEPAMALARNASIQVSGPLPADTAFTPDALRKFDGIVAMYHDQGLIPVKMSAFDRAAQITLGIPAIRTSPDHGTAFDIAGKNRANPGSMKAAIELAIDVAAARQRSVRPLAASAP